MSPLSRALAPFTRGPTEEQRRSPWYRDGQYVNIGEEEHGPEALPVLAFLKWRMSRAEAPVIPDAGDAPASVRALAPEDLAPPASGLKVAWLGHASVLVIAPRARIAIDPIFGAPPLVRRHAPLPIAPAAIPPQDLLLLSHNHYDHLDVRSIAALRARSPGLAAVVPSGLGGYVRALGIERTRALEWWESTEHGGVRITCVPARHWSKRSLRDTRQSHWAGFVLEADGRRLYVAGDTAMGPHFAQIAARFPGFHAAVLPIGAYSPRWFMRDRHMDPPEAVAAARILRAETILPVHWGTYKMGDEPLGEPPLYLRRAAESAEQRADIWQPGDVRAV